MLVVWIVAGVLVYFLGMYITARITYKKTEDDEFAMILACYWPFVAAAFILGVVTFPLWGLLWLVQTLATR